MRLLKPQPGVRLNPAGPLAQGLFGCWLLNEGAGDTAYDGARDQTAVGNPAPTWGPDRCEFNGVDQAFLGDVAIDLEKDFTVVTTVRIDPVSTEYIAVGMGDPTYGCRFVLGCYSSGQYRCLLRQDNNSNVVNVFNAGPALDDGRCHQLAFSFRPSAGVYHCLLDGALLTAATPSVYASIRAQKLSIGSMYRLGSLSTHWPGSVYHVYLYGRALTDGEIAQLYREPYAMFCRPPLSAAAWVASRVVDLAGAVTARSQVSASLGLVRTVSLSGTAHAVSSLNGSLQRASAWRVRSSTWISDALFNGMTTRGLKLSTVLTQGWFWMRRRGCTALYRGRTLDEVDFDNILCVVDPDAGHVTLPAHLSHEPGSTHAYVVRRFNSGGHQERTTAAATRVVVGPDGKLAAPTPNAVVGLTARCTAESRVVLRWFYCPLAQQTPPKAFTIYDDQGTVVGSVAYAGRRFYEYRTEPLEPGRHLFVVRAAGAVGIEDRPGARIECVTGGDDPQAVTLLAAEVVL